MGDNEDKQKHAIAPSHEGRSALRALLIDQEWLWRKLGLVVAFVIAMVVAVLTLSPMPAGVPIIDGLDKLYHFAAFAGLIFPLIVTDSRRWFWAVPLVILFGGAIELIQPSVGRSAEWLDFGADITGVLAGAALAEILHDRIRRSVFDRQAHLVPLDDGSDEAHRLEAMRSELMEELRVVLREELAAVPRPGAEAPVGPSPAEEATAEHRPALRAVRR